MEKNGKNVNVEKKKKDELEEQQNQQQQKSQHQQQNQQQDHIINQSAKQKPNNISLPENQSQSKMANLNNTKSDEGVNHTNVSPHNSMFLY